MRFTSAVLGALAAAPSVVSALDLRLLTYNIRYANNRPGKNELRWNDRRPMLAQQLKDESNENTLMCFQEAYHHVVQDISTDLGDDWSWVGRGRDDGDKKGEFSPIFYRNDIWHVSASNTYWLSSTPDKPSKSWDANQRRIVTVAELTHRDSGDKLAFLCTHFEWKGKTAQARSADIILDLVDSYSEDIPVFVAGDLNLEPSEKPYSILTSELTDFRTLSKQQNKGGFVQNDQETALGGAGDENVLTYTGFTAKEQDMLIDYIFVRDKYSIRNAHYSVPSNLKDDKYISDHRPVIVDVQVARSDENSL